MKYPFFKTIGSWPSLWCVGLLVLVTALVWCGHYDRWTLASWSFPTEYAGDAPEILAQMRAAADGDIIPLAPKTIERLGAPFGASWNALPTPDKPLLMMAGLLTHVVGLFGAANLMLLLAPVTAALAFYFTARWLRCRWEWAWAGALLFAYTYQTFHRGLGHFSITFTWTVPLGLLAAALVAKSRRLEWRSPGAVVCLVAAIGMGVSNPYNLMFWIQLMGWAVVAQWFDRRRRINLLIGLSTLGLAMGVFFASNLEVWFYLNEPGGAPLMARNYAGTEMYALKPVEMLIPPTFHRWDALAFLGHRYVRWSLWRGESYLPYLGIIGIAGLLALALVSARKLFARRPVPGAALSIGWLVAYASIGGLTNVVALLAGIQIFRATNRVGIFISALVMIFLMVRLSRLTARWPSWSRLTLALGIGAFGVLDQIPRPRSPEAQAEIVKAVNSDRTLGRELESALPTGAMIFQLPVLGFPEVLPPHRMADYELFRPFLVTETLRFSYGAAKLRARSRWQRDLENLPVPALVRRLERYGFAALYINRKGYDDHAESVLRELTALGYHRRIEGAFGNQIAILLNPQAKPEPPMARNLTMGAGWHPRPEDGIRWANADAAMSYFNPYSYPITVHLKLKVVGVTEREIALEMDRRVLAKVRATDVPVSLDLPQLELPPGVTVLKLTSGAPAVRLGTGRYQLRTFGLQSASIRVVSLPGLEWDDAQTEVPEDGKPYGRVASAGLESRL